MIANNDGELTIYVWWKGIPQEWSMYIRWMSTWNCMLTLDWLHESLGCMSESCIRKMKTNNEKDDNFRWCEWELYKDMKNEGRNEHSQSSWQS